MVGRLGGRLILDEGVFTNRMMRKTFRDKKSSWGYVTSGVPQGSVLAPVMFAIYANDMIGVDSYLSLFADYAEIIRVKSEEDCNVLRRDLDIVWEWSEKWETEMNITKCSVFEFEKSVITVKGHYKLGNGKLAKKTEEKDLGVMITDTLSPESNVNKITAETYNLQSSIQLF